MAGSKLFTMLSIILIIDLVFFLFAAGMSDVNNEYNISSGNSGFDYSRSFLSDFNAGDEGNYTLVNKTSDVIPEESQAVSESGTGNIFTDTISSITDWFSDAAGDVVGGFNYLFNILGGPVYYLSWMGAPQALTWGIAAVWYGLSLLLIIGFIFGRL